MSIIRFRNLDKAPRIVILCAIRIWVVRYAPGRLEPREKNHSTGCVGRGQLKCEVTRAETKFRLSAKRTSPFKSAGPSVQSTTDSRGVRISGGNAGYTVFRGSVKSATLFASFPFTSPPVRHRVPSHFNWSLPWCAPQNRPGCCRGEECAFYVPGI